MIFEDLNALVGESAGPRKGVLKMAPKVVSPNVEEFPGPGKGLQDCPKDGLLENLLDQAGSPKMA